MAISNKIKALLKLKKVKTSKYASDLKLSNANALNTKYTRESFKAQELIILGESTNTQLAFIDKETGKPLITFDIDDIKKDTQ